MSTIPSPLFSSEASPPLNMVLHPFPKRHIPQLFTFPPGVPERLFPTDADAPFSTTFQSPLLYARGDRAFRLTASGFSPPLERPIQRLLPPLPSRSL